VIVLHKKNGGVSSARNLGLNQSHGEYVCFVDSDDYIAPEYLQTLYDLICKYNVEIAACSWRRVTNGNFSEQNLTATDLLVSDKDKWLNILENNNSAEGYLWNKLYSKKCIGNLRFDEKLSMCEDQLFVFQAMEGVKDIAVTNKPLYYYRVNYNSATHSSARLMVDQRLIVSQKIQDIVCKHCSTQVKNKYYQLVFDARCGVCTWLAKYRPQGWKQELRQQRNILLRESEGFTKARVSSLNKYLKKNVLLFLIVVSTRSYLSWFKRMARRCICGYLHNLCENN